MIYIRKIIFIVFKKYLKSKNFSLTLSLFWIKKGQSYQIQSWYTYTTQIKILFNYSKFL